MTTANLNVDLLCPHCVAPIERSDDFCPTCGGPITSHASIDPLGQIYSAGYAYRQAVAEGPTRIVVLGMWLIFGPQALGAVLMIYGLLGGRFAGASYGAGDYGGFQRILAITAFTALLVLYVAILAKVTTRYRAAASPVLGQ